MARCSGIGSWRNIPWDGKPGGLGCLPYVTGCPRVFTLVGP